MTIIFINYHFRLVLLNKLLEDGNTLFRHGRLGEAAYRYEYALKRLPRDQCYKTFYVRNLQMFVISLCICVWRVFQPILMFASKAGANQSEAPCSDMVGCWGQSHKTILV